MPWEGAQMPGACLSHVLIIELAAYQLCSAQNFWMASKFLEKKSCKSYIKSSLDQPLPNPFLSFIHSLI
jgi:hypothetical protein